MNTFILILIIAVLVLLFLCILLFKSVFNLKKKANKLEKTVNVVMEAEKETNEKKEKIHSGDNRTNFNNTLELLRNNKRER